MIKPDATGAGNTGAITKMIEEAGFKIIAMSRKRELYFRAIRNERCRRLEPEKRFLRQRFAGLASVVGIIQAHGDHLARTHWCERAQPFKFGGFLVKRR